MLLYEQWVKKGFKFLNSNHLNQIVKKFDRRCFSGIPFDLQAQQCFGFALGVKPEIFNGNNITTVAWIFLIPKWSFT